MFATSAKTNSNKKKKPKQTWQKYIKMPSTCALPKTLKMNQYIT